MDRTRIEAALRQAETTREIVIGRQVLRSVNPVLGRWFGDGPALIIADENTMAVAGSQVADELEAAGRPIAGRIVFPGSPVLHPDIDHVQAIEARLRSTRALPVAVGSGTLNDLTKLAAHRSGTSYLVVATAASMDGYTSFAAAITHQGVKMVDDCAAPRAVIADLEVLSGAPAEMTASGYADLLGKVVAGPDWLLADALGVEALDSNAWGLVAPYFKDWTADPAGLTAGRGQAFEALIEGLLLSGLSMQAARSSRPASGAEHLFSHLWEMQGVTHNGRSISHGFKVGVGTLAAAALYERLLARDLGNLDTRRAITRWPSWESLEREIRAAHPDPRQAESAVACSRVKYLDTGGLTARLRSLARLWPDLKPRLEELLLPTEQIRSRLAQAGCPTGPEAIGVTRTALRRSYVLARQIRSRYTLLDLTEECGLMEDCLGELFSPAGFWGSGG